MLRRLVASDHLGKQIQVVIALSRHLFPDRLQLFQKTWSLIHKFDFRLIPFLPQRDSVCDPADEFPQGRKKDNGTDGKNGTNGASD